MQASTLPLVIAPRLRAPRGGLLFGDRQYRGGVFLPAAARPILEAVAARAAVAAQAEPVTVGILGFAYRVRSIPIAASVGTVAFEIIPTDRPLACHHLHRDNAGEVVCTCGDFIHRRQGTGSMCKHGRALAELGLVKSTTPRILPPSADRNPLPRPWAAPTPTYGNRFEPSAVEIAEAAALLGW